MRINAVEIFIKNNHKEKQKVFIKFDYNNAKSISRTKANLRKNSFEHYYCQKCYSQKINICKILQKF